MTKRYNYRKHQEGDSFIARFMQYMGPLETSSAYDFWCACWLIAVACGRSAYIPRPRAPVYLNWYILLLADSGVTRKSTAIRNAMKIVARLQELLPEDLVNLIEGGITPEALIVDLSIRSKQHGTATTALASSELVSLLGKERYKQALPGKLTDLYDCPATHGASTISSERVARNPFVTLLGASTPTWMSTSIHPDTIAGGFTSRCMFVISEKRKQRVAWPQVRGTEDEELDELVRLLYKIYERCQMRGTISLNETAMKRYTTWYNRKEHHTDPFRSSFESREDDHVLRLAATLAIADNAWCIDAYHFSNAVAIVQEIKNDGMKLFDYSVTVDDTVIAIDRLRHTLILAGIDGVRQTDLFKKVRKRMSAKEFNACLAIMHELGLLTCYEATLSVGRPVRIWKATKQLTSKGVTDAVLNKLGAK